MIFAALRAADDLHPIAVQEQYAGALIDLD
jgi:hypothetical protein